MKFQLISADELELEMCSHFEKRMFCLGARLYSFHANVNRVRVRERFQSA